MESALVSTNWRMHKENVAYIHNEVLFDYKEK